MTLANVNIPHYDHYVSSILCYSMFQSLDASLGLKDLSCIQYAQYLKLVVNKPQNLTFPRKIKNR